MPLKVSLPSEFPKSHRPVFQVLCEKISKIISFIGSQFLEEKLHIDKQTSYEADRIDFSIF